MAKMGKGKACGPDELPIEAVHIILDYKAECIVKAFNNILRTNKMPNDWRKSRMVPIVKRLGLSLHISILDHIFNLLVMLNYAKFK